MWKETCSDGISINERAIEMLQQNGWRGWRGSIMTSNRIRVLLTGAAVLAIGVCAEIAFSSDATGGPKDPVDAAVSKGLKWLVSTQGKDGGWGQDGGETSYVRQGEHLESNGNDVANTAVVAEALLHTGTTIARGPYREPLQRAVAFVLNHVEQSPPEGLAVTGLQGTQIQRKLGPYIDTFMTAKLLAELDGTMATAQENARVRQNLQKCVAKIEKNQLKDGSWNVGGGWAPSSVPRWPLKAWPSPKLRERPIRRWRSIGWRSIPKCRRRRHPCRLPRPGPRRLAPAPEAATARELLAGLVLCRWARCRDP